MTVLLAVAAIVCLLLALGGWYDLRHRARGDRGRVDGSWRVRRDQLEQQGRHDRPRGLDLDWF